MSITSVRGIVGAICGLAAYASLQAQTPTEDEVWGYTTTATGTDVFDTLAAAQGALLAVNDSLVRVGEPRISDEEVGIIYRSETELPPSEGVVWIKCDPWDCEGSASSYEDAVSIIEPTVAYLEAQSSPGYCPTFEVSDWMPTWVVNGVVRGAAKHWTGYNPCSFWNPPEMVTWAWGVRWEQLNGIPGCPLDSTWDAAAGVCRSETTEEISVRRLTESDDCPIGNPCYASTGNKRERYLDYEGPSLTLERFYNSRYADYSNPNEQPLGRGWTHSYASKIVIDDEEEPAGLYRPNGDLLALTSIGTDHWAATNGSQLQLRDDGGVLRVYLPSGGTESYDSTGHLLSLTDRAGRTTTLAYGDGDRLESVTGPFGHELAFYWTLVPGSTDVYVIDHIEDPAGNELIYVVEDGLLEEVEYQDGSTLGYLYEDTEFPDLLTGVVDENQSRYKTFAYDSRGRATLTEHADGFTGWTLAYNSNNTVTATDAKNQSSEYAFQSGVGNGRAIGGVTRDGDNSTRTNETTGQHRLLSSVDPLGIATTYAYDSYHLTSATEADGEPEERVTEYGYLDDTSSRPTNVTTASVYASHDREVVTTYNTADLPETVGVSGYTPSGVAVSRSIGFEYNTLGQIVEIDGPRTDVTDITTFEYYECMTGGACGQLESVTNALGHVTTFDAYDDHGDLLEMTDANGVVTEYTYDDRGRTTSVTETPAGGTARVTTYAYDDAGLLESVEAPNGMVLTFDYDAAHNLQSVTDNLGNTIEYGYDLNGNRTIEDTRDPSSTLRRTVDLTYDARNRVESINAAGSITELAFDALGNLTDETDPNTNDTNHGYDSLSRLAQTVDALSGITEYGYDRNDNLTSVEAPNGATTAQVYDDLGNLLSLTSPDTGTTTYTHDAAGNRLTQTDANGVTVTFTYDALNRLLTTDYPGSSLDVTLTYDQGTAQQGRLTTMADGSGTTTFEYDVFGNLTEESKTIGANTHVTAFGYDAADLLVSVTYPSGRTIDYARNVLGQVTSVDTTYAASTTTVADDIEYEPFGPLKGLTFGNSLALARTFDQQYRLTDQTTGAVQDLAFTLDDAGNIDAIGDSVNVGLGQGFAQDALHRVTTEAGSYGTKGYTYDGVGNRLTRTHAAITQTLTYTTNSNRIATHDGQTVSLDAAGNTLGNPAENVSFVYDDHNRMVEAYVGGMLKASYVYNGRGQRIKKNEATGAQRTIVYHYGLGGELLGETVYSSTGAKIGERDYLWLGTLPLAQSERVFLGGSVTSSQFVYLHADHLNTPRLATNNSGNVVWRWDSDAFGVGAANQDPDSDTTLVDVRLRFPGQYLDDETGLHYNYFRDYDPVTSRYVESDPIGLAGGLNSYLYVDGNPLAVSDPLGLQGRTSLLAEGVRIGLSPTAPSQPGSAVSVPYTIRQIQRIDPTYTYTSTGGNSFNRVDIAAVTGAYARYREAEQFQCLAPGPALSRVGSGLPPGGTSGGPNRIYSARELVRSANEPGPMHNFPASYNALIFSGNRTAFGGNYVQYTQRGSINGYSGTFEIGVRVSQSGRTEVITHRLFRPDR